MELRDAIELLYTAYKRFSSVQVAWSYWLRTNVMNEALERWSSKHPSGSVNTLESAQGNAFTEWGKETDAQESTMHWHVWLQRPASWRSEYYQHEKKHSGSVRIVSGDRWWLFDRVQNHLLTNVKTNESGSSISVNKQKHRDFASTARIDDAINEVPLIDPSFLLASHDLQLIGSAIHTGREAIRIRAIYRSGKDISRDSMFWSAADEYELLVDKQRGVLLRYAAKLNGEEFAVASVEEIVFDELISESIFSFVPPPNALVEIIA